MRFFAAKQSHVNNSMEQTIGVCQVTARFTFLWYFLLQISRQNLFSCAACGYLAFFDGMDQCILHMASQALQDADVC